MRCNIVPTLIANNQKELDELIFRYSKYFNYFQVDVMDGKFVRNKSNWFDFILNKKYKYEAHLMVNDPENWIKNNYKNFDILIANFEKVKDPLKLIKFVKSKKKKIGFALNPETSIIHIIPYLKMLDLVLILAVHPGQYGAKFLDSTCRKVEILRMKYKGDIEIDGHEDPKHIKILKKNGANIFAVGSYLKNTIDLGKTVERLRKVL